MARNSPARADAAARAGGPQSPEPPASSPAPGVTSLAPGQDPPAATAPVSSEDDAELLEDTAEAGELETGTQDAPRPTAAEARQSEGAAFNDAIIPPAMRASLGITTAKHLELLAEACYVFNVNPSPTLKPRELAAHRFDPGEPDGTPPIPPSVILVTAGGLKVRYPIDAESEERLRVVYRAYRVTKEGTREVLPLPADLALPREAVDGQVRSEQHVYNQGYLRQGGREEANRRAKLEQLRRDGRIR